MATAATPATTKMTKLTILAIVVCLALTSARADGGSKANKTNDAANGKTDGRGKTTHGDGGGERQFPPFTTEGAGPPRPQPQPQGLFPGSFAFPPDDGLPPAFGPYASPQLGFGGYYPPSIIPLAPQHPQGYLGQPQIFYYAGTGQPFLVNPGSPPGNFLIPQFPQQPGQPVEPSIFNGQPAYPPLTPQSPPSTPQQPVVPPIDRDAEEIPKDILTQGNTAGTTVPNRTQTPQKLELDGSDDEPSKPAATPAAPVDIPPPGLLNLRPGQRFFILNGQPLFSNYPGFGYPQPNNLVPERYVNPYDERPQQFYPQRPHPTHQHQPIDAQQFKPVGSLASLIVRSQPQLVRPHLVPAHLKGHHFPQQADGLPITLHNQVVGEGDLQSVLLAPEPNAKEALQSRYFEKTIPFEQEQEQAQAEPVFDAEPAVNFEYNDAADDAAIIIDAKYQEPNEVEDDDARGGTEKPAESSVAEAQPGAIALAGDGGVASAGPRGTALAGAGGLAVSSPHATAVAGPAKDDVHSNSTAVNSKKPAKQTKLK